MSETSRLPIYLWVESEIRRLSAEGVGVYVTAKGDRASGVVLLKLADCRGKAKLLIQQRNIDGKLVWADALQPGALDEKEADAYIARAVARDPDMWVLEIESRDLENPVVQNAF